MPLNSVERESELKVNSHLHSIGTTTNWRWVLFAIFGIAVSLVMLMAPRSAHAEPCRTIGGCAGNVWLIHVPKRQFTGSALFQASGLPATGRIELLRDSAALLPPELFAGRYLQQLTDALAKQESGQRLLSGFGNELEKGMKVKVLSYQTFPSLGRMAGELFVVVLVLSE